MNSSSNNTVCGKPLFGPVNKPSVKKQSSSNSNRYENSEAMFLVSDNPMLYLQFGNSNERVIENLAFTVLRDPADLRAHVQRIALHIRIQDQSGLYGALVDLFIALGEKGLSIRKRMLTQAKPHLTKKHFLILNSLLERGIRDTDQVTDSDSTVLAKGYIGKNNFVVDDTAFVKNITKAKPEPSWQKTCTEQSRSNPHDPRQEASDCLMYGQVDEARKILEQAVLAEPWREDLQKDLLEIYWATRDIKGCQAMYGRLADEFIPEHHAWIQTVKRINNATGGA